QRSIHVSPYTPVLKKTVLFDDNGKIICVKRSKKTKHADGVNVIAESRGCSLLDLSNLSLDSLSADIGTLTNLQDLFLYENKLSYLPPQIGNLRRLQKVSWIYSMHFGQLWLQENYIYSLPSEMERCANLTHLDLRHNRLDGALPSVILGLRCLQQLLLTYNKLNDISGVGNLKDLQILVVKSNNLQGPLPEDLGQLTKLQILDCSKNRITILPDAIASCTKLIRLLLDYNCIGELPSSIGCLKKLQQLGIKYNQLTRLPTELAQCQQLTELNIEGNQITRLPHLSMDYNNLDTVSTNDFADAEHLRSLTMGNNNIVHLEIVASQWRQLVQLDLSYNRITKLPEDFCELANLEDLDLTSNWLKPPQFSYSENAALKYFVTNDKKWNFKEAMHIDSAWRNLHNLTSLKLEDNMIQRLPTQIGDLKQLTRLCLKNNKPLDQLPVELAALPLLSFLSLEGCNLRQIPGDIVQAGAGAVI
ncbi:leucine Rich repeat-containing domain protein, partial [Opisthorchis viverrini]